MDFISGPSRVSTSCSFSKLKTGTLTATYSASGYQADAVALVAQLSPNIMRVAISTIGTPVTLLIYGMVLEERGLTSMT